MEYTYNQKMAIAKVLLEIMNADGKIDARETFYFEKVKNKLKLSPEDHFKIADYNSLVCLSIIKELDDNQKKDFAILMKRMIFADDYIDLNESLVFENVKEFCKIPDINLND